ncbi:MAG TPA: tetratricopeptide repeat protein, partial [Pirellulales bacterium]|nr:tetratricopeptide repeat protein [Pirellulales bacterium]
LSAKYKVGSRVIVIHETPLRVDDVPVKQLEVGTPLAVEELNDQGFLGVTSGKQGWVDAADVVPLDEALEPLSKLLAQDADNVKLHQARAAVAEEKKNWDLALEDLAALIRLEPDKTGYLINRADIWAAKREWDKAIDDLNEVVRRDDNPGFALLKRGYIWSQRKEPDKALADFNEALSKDLDDTLKAEVLSYRAGLYMDQHETEKAMADFGEALKLNPRNPTVFVLRGNAYAEQKNFKQAIADFTAALWLDSDDPDIYDARGDAFVRNAEWHAAIADFQKAIKLAPDRAQPHNELAWILATCPEDKFRDGKTAVEEAKKAAELTDNKDAAIIDTLAAAYAENGDFDKALELQKKAVDLETDEKTKVDMKTRLDLFQQHKPYRENPAERPTGD